jgi:hypothetical protein
MYVEEIRGTEMELMREIKREGSHRSGTWVVNLEGPELASSPSPRNQPQRSTKVHPVWSGRKKKWLHDHMCCLAAPAWGDQEIQAFMGMGKCSLSPQSYAGWKEEGNLSKVVKGLEQVTLQECLSCGTQSLPTRASNWCHFI